MSFGKLGAMGRGFGHLGGLGTTGASGPYPPPAGFHWVYVTESGVRVTESGAAVVELVAVGIS